MKTGCSLAACRCDETGLDEIRDKKGSEETRRRYANVL